MVCTTIHLEVANEPYQLGVALRASGRRAGKNGGGRGIRTPDTLSGIAVFKTACFNRSHIPPREYSLLETAHRLPATGQLGAASYPALSSFFTVSLTTLPSTRVPAAANFNMAVFITVPMSFIVGVPISEIVARTTDSISSWLAAFGM